MSGKSRRATARKTGFAGPNARISRSRFEALTFVAVFRCSTTMFSEVDATFSHD
jgi:hypothetical protein